MGEEMAKRNWPFCGPQSRFARGIKAFEYLWSRKFGQNVCNLVIERKLAPLDKLHGGSRGDGLGHGGDPEHCVGAHRSSLGWRSPPKCSLIDNFVARRCHRDHTRHITTIDCEPENLVHL